MKKSKYGFTEEELASIAYLIERLEKALSKIYVYMLWDPIKQEPFWIGVSHNPWKRFEGHKSKTGKIVPTAFQCKLRIRRIQSNGGWDEKYILRILDRGLLRRDALKIERELIKQYGTVHDGTGPLLNSPNQDTQHEITTFERKICLTVPFIRKSPNK